MGERVAVIDENRVVAGHARPAADGRHHGLETADAGAELDLVLRLPSGFIFAIEIKRTALAKVSQGFHLAAADINADQRILVYAGDREVPFGGVARAMPLSAAVRKLQGEAPAR